MSFLDKFGDVELLFEDADLAVVNKPPGLASEGKDGNDLLSILSEQLKRKIILYHRLDKATSGTLLIGKTRRWNKEIAELFLQKRMRKSYWAMVEGGWSAEWNRVETFIRRGEDGLMQNHPDQGKSALTTFHLLKGTDSHSWIQALPKTGRTHQIRLHCLAKGCPVVGDPLYGNGSELEPLALHAESLSFRHPGTGKTIQVKATPPSYWQKWFDQLGVRKDGEVD
jgi:RluA family pseudouridine synthase